MSTEPLRNEEDEKPHLAARTGRSRVAAVVAPILLAFVSVRGIITHSTAGVVSFILVAAVLAAVALSTRPTLRPVPLLVVGVYGALLGFVGIGGARNPLAGWFSLFWMVLGVLGLVVVIRPDHTTPSPRA